MATEVLAIPEENLSEVVIVIRAGLNSEEVSPEVSERLGAWCDDIEEYLERQILSDEDIEEALMSADQDDPEEGWQDLVEADDLEAVSLVPLEDEDDDGY